MLLALAFVCGVAACVLGILLAGNAVKLLLAVGVVGGCCCRLESSSSLHTSVKALFMEMLFLLLLVAGAVRRGYCLHCLLFIKSLFFAVVL